MEKKKSMIQTCRLCASDYVMRWQLKIYLFCQWVRMVIGDRANNEDRNMDSQYCDKNKGRHVLTSMV